MRYSIEPRDGRYVKRYRFLPFAKNIGKNISSKYSQKIVESLKKSATDAIKTASKRAIRKTAEATRDLTGYKFADKITSISKNLQKSCTQRNRLQMKLIMKYPKKDIYLQKKDQKLLMN